MRVFFIPFDTRDILSNHGFGSRIYRLSMEDKVLGIKRNRSFETPSEGFVKFFNYGLKVFVFGLKNRNDFDLIYCYGAYTLFGAAISILTGKPCVR